MFSPQRSSRKHLPSHTALFVNQSIEYYVVTALLGVCISTAVVTSCFSQSVETILFPLDWDTPSATTIDISNQRVAVYAPTDSLRGLLIFEKNMHSWVQTSSIPNSQWGQINDGRIVTQWTEGDTAGVYIYQSNGADWSEEARFISEEFNDPPYALSLEGNRLVIGAPHEHLDGFWRGTVRIFEFDGESWVQTTQLFQEQPVDQAFFGSGVALNGDRLAVGAQGVEKIYLFEHNGTEWIHVSELVGHDDTNGSGFGGGIAFAGDYLVAGAPGPTSPKRNGAAYVFERTPTGWHEAAKLVGDDLATSLYFGSDVSLSGASLAIGARGRREHPHGAVYVYSRQRGHWELTERVIPSDGAYNFGSSVVLEDNLLGVVAFATLDLLMSGVTGAAYLYELAEISVDTGLPTESIPVPILHNPYPNPSSGNTVISYHLAEPGHINLEIFDVLGRRVNTLINEFQSLGLHRIEWRGDNLPPGIYFCRLKTPNQTLSRIIVLRR